MKTTAGGYIREPSRDGWVSPATANRFVTILAVVISIALVALALSHLNLLPLPEAGEVL